MSRHWIGTLGRRARLVRGLLRVGCLGVLAAAVLWVADVSAASDTVPSHTVDLVLSYAGMYQDSYTNGDRSSAVTLKFAESQQLEVAFPLAGVGAGGAGTARVVSTRPITLSVSGSITGTDPDSPPDDCTISAGSTANVVLAFNSGSVDRGKDTLEASAGIPLNLGDSSSPGPIVVSGSNYNCADVTDGIAIAPHDYLNPPPGGFQDEPAWQSSELPTIADVDAGKLPYSKSFPAQWTESDSLGGTERVTITDTFTVAGACNLGSAAAATAASEEPDHECGTYVALGDSYASGEGLPPLGECGQSPHAYPHLVQNALDYRKLYFDACSGATTIGLRDQVNVAYQRRELSKATWLVTITIGGDDIDFARLITQCLLARAHRAVNRKAPGCFGGKYGRRNLALIANGIRQIRHRLPGELASIHQKAPNAQVMLVGYPYVFPPSSTIDCSEIHLFGISLFGHPAFTADDVPALHRTIIQLNNAVKSAMGESDGSWLSFVPTTSAFRGHDACEPHKSWFTGIYVGGHQQTWSLHPTVPGQHALANAVIHAIIN